MSSTDLSSNADAFAFSRTLAGTNHRTTATGNAEAGATASQANKDLLVFNRANLEAVAQASQVYAAGMQDLIRDLTETGQTAMREALANMRALATTKTPKAAIELQATIVRSTAIHAITQGARIAQSGVDLAERTAAPLVARMVAAAELIRVA